ncbi:MAG: hypothetical protein ABGZ17_22870 [Planctomycetaceae bacterium]
MNHAKWLAWVLRANGVAMIFALPAVFMPVEWMAVAHGKLGLGTFPDGVIVQYLARTISGLYVLLGLLTVKMSLDIAPYLSLIRFWAVLNLVAGVVLLGLDIYLQLPLFWIVVQGPYVISYSGVLLGLERGMRSARCRG